MSTPILATKLYVPPPRALVVLRPRLIAQLNEGLAAGRRLILISAPAGFGKTTLAGEWVAACGRPAAWLSLDEGDSDRGRFLTYLIAALQTIAPHIGETVLRALRTPPPTESVLTALLNEITMLPHDFVLVLDDYHVIDAKPIDEALAYLLQHLPPQMRLVIATREDPHLPLSRLRVRGQLTELRASDLRFTSSEAAGFLNEVMGLNLSAPDIAALETRTEGWIAGLQLAAISMKGLEDATGFIRSFTGSHHFVMDYLVEQVLEQQPESVQTFLLRTSILDRLCGPLCDAVLHGGADPIPASSVSGQETLEYLEHANLFIVPLDDERRWYRYHHLFADLLRQRLHQIVASSTGEKGEGVAALHIRASQWYEDNGLEIEAFRHAAAANDVARAERLIEGKEMPLQFRGALAPILQWLRSLPATVLDARPSLWITYASVLLGTGQTTAVEQKLQAAESALQRIEPDDRTRDLVGRIASVRAMLALSQRDAETIIAHSLRALEDLHPDNLSYRTSAVLKLAYAYVLRGDRAEAKRAYRQAASISQASGNIINDIMASIGLGGVQEADNQLYQAAETYRRALQLAADLPFPAVSEAHLGLARICYQWNDLEAAEEHGQQSLQLARQLENTDRPVACTVFLARLKLARGDVAGAAAFLTEADRSARRHGFGLQIPEIAAAQVLVLLHQGQLAAAAQLAQSRELPLSLGRVLLAQGDASAALSVLEPLRRQMEARGWVDEQLKVLVLQAVALYAQGEKDKAVQALSDALALAEPGGLIRLFVDQGGPMAPLLSEAAARGMRPNYVSKLLAALQAGQAQPQALPIGSTAQALVEPLSPRELEVLNLIAQGLSNREIGARLCLALSTVKGHSRVIFDKLQVSRRTEAVARARKLGLL